MDRQTITIRRVGAVTFGFVLVVTGVLFLIHAFYPQLHLLMIYRFWPVILIILGVEVLLGNRHKNFEVLDESGKIVEKCRTVYDVPAILMMSAVSCFAMVMALVYWVYETNNFIIMG